jgi:hypothetical protein
MGMLMICTASRLQGMQQFDTSYGLGCSGSGRADGARIHRPLAVVGPSEVLGEDLGDVGL